jgi:PhnB protein
VRFIVLTRALLLLSCIPAAQASRSFHVTERVVLDQQGDDFMIKLEPYLNFNGNTEEAFAFYRSVFGGAFSSLVRLKDMPMPGVHIPAADADKIMHISLPIGRNTLMGSDSLESMDMKWNQGNNFYIFIEPDSKAEADRLFDALSAGGEVEMPMALQSWGDYFGSFRDRFGIQWMIDMDLPDKSTEEV